MEKFDKIKYNMEYRKKHKAVFSVDLNKEEKEEIDLLLKQHKITKVDFVRDAIKNFKEDLKMKKYYIWCSTSHFKNYNGKFIRESDTVMNNNDKYIGFYDTYEEAIKVYNNITLRLDEEEYSINADYKELYEYDTNEISEEDIKNGDFDTDNMKLLEEEYTKL